MVCRWGASLMGIGVAQMLFSGGMIAAGGMSIAACEELFHTSWAAITGGCLFVLGALNAFGGKCTPRILLSLGVINFVMVGAAVAAIVSGSIGMRCEVNGGKTYRYDSAACYSFAKEIHCVNDRWMTDDNSTGAPTTYSTSNQTLYSHRLKGMIINGVVLGTGVVLLVLCTAAAAISIRASEGSRTGDPPPQQFIQAPQDLCAHPWFCAYAGSQVPVEKAETTPGDAISGINSHDANAVKVTTTINKKELKMSRGGGTIGAGPSRSSSSGQSQQSYSDGSNRSSGASKSASRSSWSSWSRH